MENDDNTTDDTNDYVVYDIDWTQVSSAPAATDVDITTIGNCACDLHLRACDMNCCCDEECSASEQELFSECSPEGPPEPSLTYCVADAAIAEVNLPSSSSLTVVRKEPSDDDWSFSSQLCIAQDNNAELGYFFADPEPGDGADLTNRIDEDDTDFWLTEDSSSTSSGTSSGYTVGDEMQAVYNMLINGSAYTASAGAFTVPTAVWSSACTSDTKVLFGENLPGSAEDRSESCYISTRDLQADCSSTFSGQLWNELAIATNNAQTPTYIAVTLSKMDYLYPNGELVAYNAPPTLPASGVVPEAEYNTATGVCENALQSVALTILHDGLGSISSILAAMVATDVMLDSTTGWATLEQQHSIRFLVTAEASTARPKSGNPGYYPNFPVLAGTLASDPDVTSSKQAISRHIAGLPMPAPTTAGMCGVNSRESVKFGMNTLSTCTIPLTLPGITAIGYCHNDCARLSEVRRQQAGLGLWGGRDRAREGAAGEQIALLGDPTEMAWDSATSTCTNVVVGLEYEFLTAYVGQLENPQSEITFARVNYKYATWTFSDQRGAANDPSTQQHFALQHSARFVGQEQEGAKGTTPEPPPIFPKLPSDIFYPFVSSAPSGREQLPGLLALTALATLLMSWQVL
ncbi:hypothetical protein CYMTET_24757 [Cymbomonas tetramitiformis]|uniref:Tectonic domain-containing protein n=1 Tax=Cymbomonas tetramitiformis TaxID=36881 RepID=A0AAE0KZR0_9CHLO|nr:hypothetical protein CYMTET_24757 [Cymbomonas tetramitiformis]